MRLNRESLSSVIALAGLVVVAILVGGYILLQQRLPFPWADRYEVRAEFASAQAVTPGQGQQVTVAGVEVGDVSRVDLKDGRALVTLTIDRDRLDRVSKDATMLLRPKTPLQDMSIDLDPGTVDGPALGEDDVLPVARTQASVNVDEVLASLDTDTRNYLRIMVSSFGEGLHGRGVNLRRAFGASAPATRQLSRLDDALKGRRGDLRSLVTKVKVLTGALADQRGDIQRLVGAGNATFSSIAHEQAPLEQGLSKLPGTLQRANTVIDEVGPFFGKLTRTSNAATPLARRLEPTLDQLGAFAQGAVPAVRELRRFTPEAQPVARQLKTTLAQLRPVPAILQPTLEAARETLNELSYVPGGKDRSYLYWLAWFGHNVNSMLSTQDANGVAWRSVVVASCTSLTGLPPAVGAATPLAKLTDICPKSPGS